MGLSHLAAAGALLLFFGQTQVSFSQLTYTVKVKDVSEAGSLIKASGTASFTETRTQNLFHTSSRFQILLKNVTDKDILLLLAQVREAGPHGPIKEHDIKRDHFFWGEMSARSSLRLVSDEKQSESLLPL